MADRTAARIAKKVFINLAKNPTEENKTLAKELFIDFEEYDFSWYQMCADEALITLGLAKKGIDIRYPEEGERILYFGDFDFLMKKR